MDHNTVYYNGCQLLSRTQYKNENFHKVLRLIIFVFLSLRCIKECESYSKYSVRIPCVLGQEKGLQSLWLPGKTPASPFHTWHSRPPLILCFEGLRIHVTISLMSQIKFSEKVVHPVGSFNVATCGEEGRQQKGAPAVQSYRPAQILPCSASTEAFLVSQSGCQ